MNLDPKSAQHDASIAMAALYWVTQLAAFAYPKGGSGGQMVLIP